MSLSAVLALWFVSTRFYFRVDLTGDKKYSLSLQTKQILKNLDSDVFVKVYLEGDMPVGLKRMRRSIREMIEEMRVYAGNRLAYDFINPSAETDPVLRMEFQNSLMEKGLRPVDVIESRQQGGTDHRRVFPGMIMSRGTRSLAVNLLSNNPGMSAQENMARSLQMLEYEIVRTLLSVTSEELKKIAFVEGHGEIDYHGVMDITMELARFYEVFRGFIDLSEPNLHEYAAVVIAGPTKKYSEAEKFVLDQYIMNGGRVLWLIDAVNVHQDSLTTGETTIALPVETNLDDMLFRYGARLNLRLIRDLQCALVPVNSAGPGETPRFVPAPWQYFPLLAPRKDHPVTRNLNFVKAQYAGTIDTVGPDMDVKKTGLLVSSQFTRTLQIPAFISLRQIDEVPVREAYNEPFRLVAVLLEGTFGSAFRNRIIDGYPIAAGRPFREESLPTSMIVVSDADIIRNDVRGRGSTPEPLPLGYDRFMQQTFGNKEFLMNAVNYLTDDAGLMELRVRELKMRLLNRGKVMAEGAMWKLLNIIVPLLFVVFFGIFTVVLRKRKYTRQSP